MKEEEITKWITENVTPKLASLDDKSRSEMASQLMQFGFEIARGIEGNEFIKGWLDEASKYVKTNPSFLVLKRLQ